MFAYNFGNGIHGSNGVSKVGSGMVDITDSVMRNTLDGRSHGIYHVDSMSPLAEGVVEVKVSGGGLLGFSYKPADFEDYLRAIRAKVGSADSVWVRDYRFDSYLLGFLHEIEAYRKVILVEELCTLDQPLPFSESWFFRGIDEVQNTIWVGAPSVSLEKPTGLWKRVIGPSHAIPPEDWMPKVSVLGESGPL